MQQPRSNYIESLTTGIVAVFFFLILAGMIIVILAGSDIYIAVKGYDKDFTTIYASNVSDPSLIKANRFINDIIIDMDWSVSGAPVFDTRLDRVLANRIELLENNDTIFLFDYHIDNYMYSTGDVVKKIAYIFDVVSTGKNCRRRLRDLGGAIIMDLLTSNNYTERCVLVNIAETDVITTILHLYKKIDNHMVNCSLSYYKYKAVNR